MAAQMPGGEEVRVADRNGWGGVDGWSPGVKVVSWVGQVCKRLGK